MMVISELDNNSDTTWEQSAQLDQNHCIVSSLFSADRKISWFLVKKEISTNIKMHMDMSIYIYIYTYF